MSTTTCRWSDSLLLAGMLAALPAAAADFTGIWKTECKQDYGVQIMRQPGGLYSVSFCGLRGCFSPGTWKPNTLIEGDPDYRVIDENNLEIGERKTRYRKCSEDPNWRRPRIFQANRGLPDYRNQSPFFGGISQALRDSIAQTTASAENCNVGSVSVPNLGDVPLSSNICDRERFEWIRALLTRVAPPLKRQNLTFFKTSLGPGREGLLVGHIDISNDEPFRYPYLSLWFLEGREPSSPVYGGTYLAGEVHALRPFGAAAGGTTVFVKYQSCIECHPWIYLAAINFALPPSDNVYQFTYADDHQSFAGQIEYELPGKGHSVEATVETRIPPHDAQGPHLLQQFKFPDGSKDEWWIFTCRELKCDYVLHEGELPARYRDSWQRAPKL